MSYCRFSTNSDVYLYSSGEVLVWCACQIYDYDYLTQSRQEMLSHLSHHEKFGHKVLIKAKERLEKEFASFGDLVKESDSYWEIEENGT